MEILLAKNPVVSGMFVAYHHTIQLVGSSDCMNGDYFEFVCCVFIPHRHFPLHFLLLYCCWRLIYNLFIFSFNQTGSSYDVESSIFLLYIITHHYCITVSY